MAHVLDCNAAAARDAGFELDRLELNDGHLRVSGRWRGVRGRRFVRPTLTVVTDTDRHRLLAELEHKPWSAEAEPWQAAFPWERDLEDLREAELAVAPDISIALALPGGRRQRGASARVAVPRAEHERVRAALERLGTRVQTLEQERERLAGEHDRVLSERADAEETVRRTAAQRDALLSEREELISEREALAAERDALVREREELISVRDSLASERDALIAERDALAAERDRLAAGREAVGAQRDELASKSTQLAVERQALAAERDGMLAQRDQLLDEREQLLARCRKLEAERDDALAARGAALVMHNARTAAGAGAEASWAVRILAVALLLGVLIAALLALHAI